MCKRAEQYDECEDPFPAVVHEFDEKYEVERRVAYQQV